MTFASWKGEQDQKDGKADIDYREASSSSSLIDDDKELEALGYVPSFKREFSNIATVCILSSVEQRALTDACTDQLRLQYHGPML